MPIEYTNLTEVFEALLGAQSVRPRVVEVGVEVLNRVPAEEVRSPIDVPGL